MSNKLFEAIIAVTESGNNIGFKNDDIKNKLVVRLWPNKSATVKYGFEVNIKEVENVADYVAKEITNANKELNCHTRGKGK